MAKKKILIIDNDADYSETTKIVLESNGYEVCCASTKQDGLDKVDSVGPDLIIMEAKLEKVVDGFNLARMLKRDENYKNIPIIMATSVRAETGFQFSPDAGDEEWLPVDIFLEKPVSNEDMVAKVRELLL